MAGIRNDYIGVVVAVPDEESILKGILNNWTSGHLGNRHCGLAYWMSQPVVVVVSGQGEDNAREACQAMFRQYHPRLVLSVGFCGGVQVGPRAGDIITSAKIVRESDVLTAHEKGDKELASVPCWLPESHIWELAQQANLDYREAQELRGVLPGNIKSCWEDTTVTSNRVVSRSQDKFALGKLSQAIAVDMESAIVAEMMSVAGIPWLVVRAISDDVSTDMPLDFGKFSDAKGCPQYGAIIKELFHKPALIPGCMRLGLNSQKARSSLREYLQYLFKYCSEFGKPEYHR